MWRERSRFFPVRLRTFIYGCLANTDRVRKNLSRCQTKARNHEPVSVPLPRKCDARTDHRPKGQMSYLTLKMGP